MYQSVLTYLRSKPKLGRGADDPDLNDFNKATEKFRGNDKQQQNDFNTLLNQLPKLTDLITQYSNTLKELDDDQTKLAVGIKQVYGLHEKYNTVINDLIKDITILEERNQDLNTSFKISSARAGELAGEIRDLSIELGYGESSIKKYAKGLQSYIGNFSNKRMNEEFKKSTIQFQAFAQQNLNLSAEQATAYETYARNIGKSGIEAALALSGLTDAYSEQTGLESLTMQAEIIEDIGSLSAEARMNFSKFPGHLEVAALKSRALGVSLEKLSKAGDNFLNIEESIGKEIEYQALTGQRLLTIDGKSLTNEYRKAHLAGDALKEAELMQQAIESQGGIIKTNMLFRKQFAEAMQVDLETVNTALEKREIAEKTGASEILKLSGQQLTDKLQQLYKDNKDDTKVQEKIANLLEQTDTRTTHERVVETQLADIAANMKKLAGGGKATVKDKRGVEVIKGTNFDIKANRTRAEKAEREMSKFKGQFGEEAVKTMGAANVSYKGAKIISTGLDVQTAAKGTGTAQLVTTGMNNALNMQPKVTINSTNSGETNNQAINKDDTIIYPNGSSPQRVSKRDVVMAFEPNNTIHRTVNDMINPPANTIDSQLAKMIAQMQRNTNNNSIKNNTTPTIDVPSLAQAIASAMKNIKVEATVKTDNLYGATSMNSRKNII